MSHHKYAPVRCSGVAGGGGLTGGVELVGLVAGEDGVLEEGVHQVGIHVTEKQPHLKYEGGEETSQESRVTGPAVFALLLRRAFFQV